MLIYSVILKSSYFIVSKFRMPLYNYFEMPTPNKMSWQVPLFIFLYFIQVISQRKLYIGLITTLVLLLSASVYYLPISNYEVWSNMIYRIYLCPFIVFMIT